MTPQERRQFEEMQRKLDQLSAIVPVDDVLLKNMTQQTVIGSDGGTVTHIDLPDRGIVIKYKGKPYLIPAYLLNDGTNSRITT